MAQLLEVVAPMLVKGAGGAVKSLISSISRGDSFGDVFKNTVVGGAEEALGLDNTTDTSIPASAKVDTGGLANTTKGPNKVQPEKQPIPTKSPAVPINVMPAQLPNATAPPLPSSYYSSPQVNQKVSSDLAQPSSRSSTHGLTSSIPAAYTNLGGQAKQESAKQSGNKSNPNTLPQVLQEWRGGQVYAHRSKNKLYFTHVFSIRSIMPQLHMEIQANHTLPKCVGSLKKIMARDANASIGISPDGSAMILGGGGTEPMDIFGEDIQ
jgi:hypothetical protein